MLTLSLVLSLPLLLALTTQAYGAATPLAAGSTLASATPPPATLTAVCMYDGVHYALVDGNGAVVAQVHAESGLSARRFGFEPIVHTDRRCAAVAAWTDGDDLVLALTPRAAPPAGEGAFAMPLADGDRPAVIEGTRPQVRWQLTPGGMGAVRVLSVADPIHWAVTK
jgi:hypothetical protein